MNLKSIITLCLSVMYFLMCWRYYTCEIKHLCPNKTSTDVVESPSQPIEYYKNSDNYKLSDKFDWYADSIAKISIGRKLDIIGFYDGTEVNNTSYSNLGIARAITLRNLLKSKGLDTTGISIFGIKKSLNFRDSLAWAIAIDSSAFVDINSKDIQLISHHGITEIYFPTGSTEEIKSPILDSFLTNLVKTTIDKKILLTGHTDNIGEEIANQDLSLKRAESIKDILTRLGMKAENIICEGKGSASPKKENNSVENRALNRRVEISVE